MNQEMMVPERIEIRIGSAVMECRVVSPDSQPSCMSFSADHRPTGPTLVSTIRQLMHVSGSEACTAVQAEFVSLQPVPKPLLVLQTRGYAIMEELTDVCLLEAEELTDESGKVLTILEEREINRILKQIFTLGKDVHLVLSLHNSMANPLHELTFMNILRTAGYRNIFPSHDPLRLIYLLPIAEAWVTNKLLLPMITPCLEALSREFGPGSSFSLRV